MKAKKQEPSKGGTQKKKLSPPSGGTKKLKGAQSKKTGGLFGTQSTRGGRKDPNTVCHPHQAERECKLDDMKSKRKICLEKLMCMLRRDGML